MYRGSLELWRSELAAIAVLALGLSACPLLAQDERKPASEPKPAAKSLEQSSAGASKVQTSADVEVALDGHCPVSYHTDGKATKGDSKHRAEFQGFAYHLADAEKKKKFEEEPEKYVPRIGGLCTVALGGPYGNRFYGDPTVFAVVEGKLYLLSSERAKRSFDLKPTEYINRAEELYRMPEIEGACPVAYQAGGQPARGLELYRQIHRNRVYHMRDESSLEAFRKDPGRYVPMYEGYCTFGVSKGSVVASKPIAYVVYDGRTYLFSDQEALGRCMADRDACFAAAESQWQEIKNRLGKAPSTRR